LIESDASYYPETRAWALALHDQYRAIEGLTWTSRQADPAPAIVLFEDHLVDAAMTLARSPVSLLQPDGSAISEIISLAQRLGVLLTP
jgi:RES domain